MKIYLAAADTMSEDIIRLLPVAKRLHWNLFSYYYLLTLKKMEDYDIIRKASKSVLIDSGAHSFQKGKKVDWDRFTKQYADFIQDTDNEKVHGYFEMDVDNLLGYDKVLELRSVMEEVTDKVIPVWHKNRGIKDFKQMCQDYKFVSISGWRNEDVKDHQFIHFVNYAHRNGCRIHGLGLTRRKVLDKVPFDSVDSSSWLQTILYARLGQKKLDSKFATESRKSTIRNGDIIMINEIKPYLKFSFHDKKVIFVTLFVVSNLISNLLAIKVFNLGFWGLTTDCGNLLFPLGYLMADVITEVYGERTARRVIFLGLFANILLIVATTLTVYMPYPSYWTGQEAYAYMFGWTVRECQIDGNNQEVDKQQVPLHEDNRIHPWR